MGMKYLLVGEVIDIIERDAARIFKVLHPVGAAKEVIEVYCGKIHKKTGAAQKVPDFKIGAQYKGTVFLKDFCFPVGG